jgi:hypothetical protein
MMANNFFTSDLPSSFFVYAASHKSPTNDHLNKSYSFKNWLYLNSNSDLRQFNVGLAEIYYSDFFELPATTTNPPKTTASATLDIKLQEKQTITISIPKLKLDLLGLLGAITTKLGSDLKTLRIETLHYGAGIPPKSQIEFPEVAGESWFVEIDTNLANVLGFRQTTFAAGTHVSEDPQSAAAFNKLNAAATTFKIRYYKWKESTITITNEEKDDSLENWLELCGRSLATAGYEISFALSPHSETVFVDIDTPDVKFTLPKQINEALGLNDSFVFTKSMQIHLLYHKHADKELNMVYVTTDLVMPSQLGEQFHPILRAFPRKEGISTKHHIVFDPVFYQPVNSAVPNVVKITLQNQFFEHLPESKSPTVAVLHFKRVL